MLTLLRIPSPRMKSLLGLASFYAAAEYTGWGFFLLFTYGLDFGLPRVVLLNCGLWVGALIGLFTIQKLYKHTSFKLALVVKAAVFFLFASPWAFQLMPLLVLVTGISLIMYWVPFNILFMDELANQQRATWSSVLFMTISVLGVALPPLGGLVIDTYGFQVLFILSAMICLGAAFSLDLKKGKPDEMKLKTVRSIRNTRNIMLPITLEGMWDGLGRTSLMIIPIFVASSATEYGGVLAVFGLGGSFAALIAAVYSDSRFDRRNPIIGACTIGFASALLVALSPSGLVWTMSAGLMFFSISITTPFNFTAVKEFFNDSTECMVAREVYLSMGRALGVLFIALNVLYFGASSGSKIFIVPLLAGGMTCLLMGVSFSALLTKEKHLLGGAAPA